MHTLAKIITKLNLVSIYINLSETRPFKFRPRETVQFNPQTSKLYPSFTFKDILKSLEQPKCSRRRVFHCTVGEIRVFCPMGVLGVFI